MITSQYSRQAADFNVMLLERKEKIMAAQYDTLEIDLFDNLDGVGTCCSCKTFGSTYIYCPIFNLIMKDDNVEFDELGELNRCELFTKA